nr:MAG TPA: hypothetical protein [Caudoviricetes sp.]
MKKIFNPATSKKFFECLGDRGEGAFSNHGAFSIKGGKI